jgi:small subunit ribosomal protein S20
MANHVSAKKRIRQTARRTAVNQTRLSRIRTFIKKVDMAIEDKNYDAAREAFKEAQPEMHRGVSKGLFKENTISRKLSRMSAQIKALKA